MLVDLAAHRMGLTDVDTDLYCTTWAKCEMVHNIRDNLLPWDETKRAMLGDRSDQ